MHRIKLAAIAMLPLLVFLCLSDTAQGQPTLSLQNSSQATVTSLTFSVPANTSHNSAAAQQILTVIPSQGPASIEVTLGTPSSWLWVGGFNTTSFLNSVPTSGEAFIVAADTTGLSPGSTNTIYFTVCYTAGGCVPGSPGNQIQVTLNVTSGSSGTMSASPNTMTFAAVTGATVASPSSQNVEILNTAASLTCTMTASTSSGGSWLLVNGSSSAACLENSTSNEVPVSISGSVLTTLAAATYNGTITVTDSNNNSTTITVTLNVGGGAIITPSPLAFTFLYQTGQPNPASQTLAVSTNSSSQGFQLSENPFVSWLSTSGSCPFGCTITSSSPASIPLTASPGGLGVGTYTTNIDLTPQGGSQLPAIPVTLVVSNNPLLQLSTSSLTFTSGFAGQSPASQTVNVTTSGSGGAVSFSANSDSSWLSVSASSSSTPSTLTVSVNSGSLAVGTYTGHIAVQPSDNSYKETITVSLTVSNSAQIIVGPSTLLFSYETTKSLPAQQTILVTSPGQPTGFSYSVSANTCGSAGVSWLAVTPSGSTTPAQLIASVAAGSMSAGVCTGTIAITPSGSNTPVNVVVTVATAASTPLLTITQQQGFGVFTMQQGGALPSLQQLNLGSTDSSNQQTFSVGYTSAQNWLYTSTTGPTNTPLNLGVNIGSAASSLSSGTYGGTLTIYSNNGLPGGLNNQFAIPITLIITPNVSVNASPSTMSFNFIAAGSAPATQNITLTSSGGTASYTATVSNAGTTGCPTSLLSLSPASGSANGTIQVGIGSTNFSAGTYTCTIALTYLNAATSGGNITVNVTVAPAVTVTEAPTTLTYAYTIGGTQPPSQAITVTSTGAAAQFTVGTTTSSSGTSWLSVDTTSGTTAGSGTTFTKTVNVSVNTQGLTGSATGTPYTGTITISSPGVLTTPLTVSVTLTVTQPPNPQPLYVTNSASGAAGVISPGELITLKGTLLGPTTPANFTLNSSGGVSNTLGGVGITFNGIAGTPLYVSATQINVTAPWEIAGQTTVNIVVTYNGNASTPLQVRVADVAPALYTLNAQGTGQAAAINQNGTFNGPNGGTGGTVPEPAGSVVVLYGTGCGQTSPPGTTGSVASSTSLSNVTQPVSVAFGPQSNPLFGKVLFIGAAPGLVTGVCQINVQIPTGLPSGPQFVVLTVEGISSPQGATVQIQ